MNFDWMSHSLPFVKRELLAIYYKFVYFRINGLLLSYQKIYYKCLFIFNTLKIVISDPI